MSHNYKFCSCKTCRAGRHRPGSKSQTKRKTRGFRHKAKAALAKGEAPPDKIGMSYTD